MGQKDRERALAPYTALKEKGKKAKRPKGCKKCPFGGMKVGPRGNPKAALAAVAESPGIQERVKGFPLVGPSGEVFFSAFPEDVDVDKIAFITNALQCLPKKTKGQKDQTKMWHAAQCCKERLLAEVTKHPRKVILAMGNSALWSLTGNPSLKITQERGKLINSEYAEVGIIPAIHPAALLRGTGNYRQFCADVDYAMHIANGGDIKRFVLPKVYVVSSIGCAKALVKFLKTREFLAADIETSGFNRLTDKVLCLGIAYKPETVFVFTPNVFKYLVPLFEAKKPRFIWQNGKFDIAFLRREGLPARVDEDTMLLSYALDESGGIHDLEQISGDLLDAPDYKYMVKPWLPKKSSSYSLIPGPMLHEYNGIDVSLTLQDFFILREKVKSDPALEKLYTRTLIPASELLYHVEWAGMRVDTAHIAKIERFYRIKVQAAIKYIEHMIGHPINLNSPKQVAVMLYDELKLPPRHGRGTGKDILERLPQTNVVKALRRHRKAAKAYSTYVKGMLAAITIDGRLHTTFKLHGTRTGRLSSAEPNIQNIPRESLLRSMFIPKPGYKFIEVDLNQAELRSLACLSKDPGLIEIYTSTNRSIHTEMAEYLFGTEFDSIAEKDEAKMKAKMVNFGIVYGREGPSIAEQFGISIKEGWRMVNGWFERFPEAHSFIKKCRKCVRKAQTITTSFGRKKRHRIVTRENLKNLQNEASNFPHQSIASDITLQAAIRLRPILQALGCEIVNLVHDSILIEVPDNELIIEQVKKLAIGVMEMIAPEWQLTEVPFKAEGKIGDRWGRDFMKDFDRPELKEAA